MSRAAPTVLHSSSGGPDDRAYKELVALHAHSGAVVLVEPGHLRSEQRRLDRVAAHAFAMAPADRLVGAVDLCAVYAAAAAAAAADDRGRRPVHLLDLADGPASGATLAPDDGHHLVLRDLAAPVR